MAQASAEKLERTGLFLLASTPEPPCQKEQSRQSRAPDREGGESQSERELHLGGSEGDQSESMKRKGWTPP